MMRNLLMMERMGVAWWLLVAVTSTASLLTACGEQDLYKPPHSPYQIVGRVAMPSAAEDVTVLGDYAYVAGGEAGLHVVSITNPSAPVLVRTLDTVKYSESVRAASTPSSRGIIDIAFVVEGTEGITTYDVSEPDSVYSFNMGTTAVDGNGLFIEIPSDPAEPYVVYLAESWKGLRIFESDPSVPGLLRYYGVFSGTRGYAKAVSVADGYAYVADDEMGLAVLDVRVRMLGVVKVVSSLDTPGKALGVDVKDGYAYIADGPNGLVVMAVHEGETPVLVGQIALPGTCRAVMVRDAKAFLAAQDGGLHIVDVSDPANPRLLGTVATSYATGVGLANSGAVVVSDRVDGVIVLGGPGAFQDHTPPADVRDLTATPIDSTSIRLVWHAPGNDLYNGTASQYDIRYSTEAISASNWENATQCVDEPSPSIVGSQERFLVTGLQPATVYYFAVKTGDAVPNWSGLSNVASETTPLGNVQPLLTGGTVTPLVGSPGASFVFEVTYTDGDGDPPLEPSVLVDGLAQPMTQVGGDFENGALFRYEVTLTLGSYEYSFIFDDGHGHRVVTPPATGPYVGESFLMGSPSNERGRDPDETQHTVVMTGGAWVSDHEVTQEEYEAVMNRNPSRIQGLKRPVENVTWYDAVAYCNALTIQEGGRTPAYTIDGDEVVWNRAADGYRLPTEAEWERACRAGGQTAFATGDITVFTCLDSVSVDPVLDQLGWYCGNSDSTSHEVKTKQPNAAGLYDMHGNVAEWCWDWYGDLGAGVAIDPAGPPTGILRVIRGGSWYYYSRDCRSASRDTYYPNSKDDVVGFRIVRTIR